MWEVGLAVEEGVDPSGERGEGLAVTLVLELELGDHRDEVLSSRVVGPELDGEAFGGEVELEILDVKLTRVQVLNIPPETGVISIGCTASLGRNRFFRAYIRGFGGQIGILRRRSSSGRPEDNASHSRAKRDLHPAHNR